MTSLIVPNKFFSSPDLSEICPRSVRDLSQMVFHLSQIEILGRGSGPPSQNFQANLRFPRLVPVNSHTFRTMVCFTPNYKRDILNVASPRN